MIYIGSSPIMVWYDMIKISMKNAIILSLNISSKILLAKSCVRYTYVCTYLQEQSKYTVFMFCMRN